MNRARGMLLIGWLILVSLLASCQLELPEVIEVEVTRVVEQEVVEEVAVTPVPLGEMAPGPALSALARGIRSGEIDIGQDYGMAEEQRFHQIHAELIDMKCPQCHVDEAPLELSQPFSDEADPVDRRVCFGCHLTGPAAKLYEPKD